MLMQPIQLIQTNIRYDQSMNNLKINEYFYLKKIEYFFRRKNTQTIMKTIYAQIGILKFRKLIQLIYYINGQKQLDLKMDRMYQARVKMELHSRDHENIQERSIDLEWNITSIILHRRRFHYIA